MQFDMRPEKAVYSVVKSTAHRIFYGPIFLPNFLCEDISEAFIAVPARLSLYCSGSLKDTEER
jgi:hypothetical protein